MGKNEKDSHDDISTSKTSKSGNKTEKVNRDSKDSKFNRVAEATDSELKEKEKGSDSSDSGENTEDAWARAGIENSVTQRGWQKRKENDPAEVVIITEHEHNEVNSGSQIQILNDWGKETINVEEDNTTKMDTDVSGEQETEPMKWQQKILIPVQNGDTNADIHSNPTGEFVWSTDFSSLKMEENREQQRKVCENCRLRGNHQMETKILAGEAKNNDEVSEISKNPVGVHNENINSRDELTTENYATQDVSKSSIAAQNIVPSGHKQFFEDTPTVKSENNYQLENERELESLKMENKKLVEKSFLVTEQQNINKSILENSQSMKNTSSNVKYSVSDESKSDVNRATTESDTKISVDNIDSVYGNKSNVIKTEHQKALDDNFQVINKYLRQEINDIAFEEAIKNSSTKLKEEKQKHHRTDFKKSALDLPLNKVVNKSPNNGTEEAEKISAVAKKKKGNMVKNIGNDTVSRYRELIRLRQDMKDQNDKISHDLRSKLLRDQQKKVFLEEIGRKSTSLDKASDSNKIDKSDLQSSKINNKITENNAIWKIADNVKNISEELFDGKDNKSTKVVDAERTIPQESLNTKLSQSSPKFTASGTAATNFPMENFQVQAIENFRKKDSEMPKNTEIDEKSKYPSNNLTAGLSHRNEQIHIQPKFPTATINRIYLGKQSYSFPPKEEEIQLPWSSHETSKNNTYKWPTEKSAAAVSGTGESFGQFFERQSSLFKENFNSHTMRGRANVAKVTLLAVGLFTVWQIFKPKKHDLMLQKCPDCGSKSQV